MLSLLVGIATASCSVEHRPKVQYAGQLKSASPLCPKTHGTLVQQGETVVFAPDDGTWTLEGKTVGNTIVADRSRPSFDHKTFETKLRATRTETQVLGTYTTPNCTFELDLSRF